MPDRRPGSLNPLRAIKRILPRDAFAPPAHAIGLDADQQNRPAINAPKARLKKMHEWHMNFTQSDGFNLHYVCEFSRCRRSSTGAQPEA